MRRCDSATIAASTDAIDRGLAFEAAGAARRKHRTLLLGTLGAEPSGTERRSGRSGVQPLSYDLAVSQIGDAVARASAYLGEHPDEARYRDSAAVARLGRTSAST